MYINGTQFYQSVYRYIFSIFLNKLTISNGIYYMIWTGTDADEMQKLIYDTWQLALSQNLLQRGISQTFWKKM